MTERRTIAGQEEEAATKVTATVTATVTEGATTTRQTSGTTDAATDQDPAIATRVGQIGTGTPDEIGRGRATGPTARAAHQETAAIAVDQTPGAREAVVPETMGRRGTEMVCVFIDPFS